MLVYINWIGDREKVSSFTPLSFSASGVSVVIWNINEIASHGLHTLLVVLLLLCDY